MKILTSLVLLLLLLTAFLPAVAQTVPAGAWNGVTVLLADGWRYRDVTVYLDDKGAGMWILRQDGAERLVAPDRVTQIIAASGDDVTAKVLSGAPGTMTNAASSPPPPVVIPPPEQQDAVTWDGAAGTNADDIMVEEPRSPFKVALTLEGGYVLPVGDWYYSFDPSWSAGSRLRIATTSGSYIGLGFRYQDLRTSEVISADVDVDVHALIFEGTFGWVSRPSKNGSMGYFELGAALVQNEFRFAMDSDTNEVYEFSDQHGAFVVRGGLILPLSDAIAFDINASWTHKGMLFTSNNETTGSLIGIQAGFTWYK